MKLFTESVKTSPCAGAARATGPTIQRLMERPSQTMKKSLLPAAALAALLALAPGVLAADKEVTIAGTGMCAKCELKETKSCQNAVQVEKDGKKTTYYLAENKVSKDFHKNVCSETAKVTATGTVKEVDGKMQFTATKIEKK
jgi:hypothetical protein